MWLYHAPDEYLITKQAAEPQSKKDDSEIHNQKLLMENHNLKAQIEKLSQEVEDLQLRGSNTSATNKKRVRFSNDGVSPVQLLQDALPSMSASELHKLGSDIFRELGKRLSSDKTSSPTASEKSQPSSQTSGHVCMKIPASPTAPHNPKTPSSVHDNDRPGTKTKTSGYMKGTTAADARSRSRPDLTAEGLVKQSDTRTPTRHATPKISGRSAPGTREQRYPGDRRRSTHTVIEDLPRTRFNTAVVTPKTGRSIPETG